MTTATAPKPAPLYTVWERPRYEFVATEVWSGEEFGTALQAAVARLGAASVVPLDAANTASLHKVGGRPVSGFVATDADGEQRVVFITR